MIRFESIREILIGLTMLALQVVLFRHLQIYGAESDLVLIYLLWLSTKKGRTETLIFAAFFGFLQDAMTDLWGLHTFSKTFLIFVLHNYLSKVSENRFILWQIFLLILFAAFIHNMVFVGLSLFAEIYSGTTLIWSILLIGSIYTAVIGTFLHIVKGG